MPTPVAALIVCRGRAYSPKLKLEQLLRFVAACQILVDFLPQDWNLQAQAAAASCSWTWTYGSMKLKLIMLDWTDGY